MGLGLWTGFGLMLVNICFIIKELNSWFLVFQYHTIEKKTLISIAPRPHFPDILFTMDITKILNITSISKVLFKMRSLPENLEVKISLLNRDRNCQRPLSENSMLLSGDEIVQGSNSSKDRVYFLELRYTKFNKPLKGMASPVFQISHSLS